MDRPLETGSWLARNRIGFYQAIRLWLRRFPALCAGHPDGNGSKAFWGNASTRHEERQMLAFFDIGILLAAVAGDFVSLVLNVRRAVRGHGASGVPGISWLIYVALLEWRKEIFFFASVGQVGAALTGFHVLCHFAVPWTIELLCRRKS